MKKFLSLILAAMMLLSVACAEFDFGADPEEFFNLQRQSITDELTINWEKVEGADILEKEANVFAAYAGTAHASNWIGQWELVAAYISEDFIDENDVEDAEAGFIVPKMDKAVLMTIELVLDGSANDKSLGVMIDQGAYWHGHAHDMVATLTFAEELGLGTVTAKSIWDQWSSTKAVGEQTGFFNFGPTKVSVMADKKSDTLMAWEDITGVEIEDQEKMKYIGMTESGYMVLCYSDSNITTKEDADMGICYIFARVEE